MLKILRSLENVVTYFVGVSFGIMMLLTTADATGRYVFNRPIPGVYEITEKYLMIIGILGICFAYRQGAHVRINFLVNHLPNPVKFYVNYCIQVMSILFSLALIIATMLQVFYIAASGTLIDIALSLTLPLWTAYAIVPVGFFLMFLAMVSDLRHVRTGKSGLFGGEKEEEHEAI